MKVTHGKSKTPEYRTWSSMHQRCSNPKNVRFADYGGRGIKVCERWNEFENFLADMGTRPSGTSIDRIDNSRGYEPGNCRWATRSEQQSNKRPSKPIVYRPGTHWTHRHPDRVIRGNEHPCRKNPEIVRGERNGRAKLNLDQVSEIRQLCASGETQKSVAKRFGVSKSAIWFVVSGKNWQQVTT